MLFKYKKTAIILFILAVFLFVLDRYLKFLAFDLLLSFNILGDIFRFSLAKNYFIAFSLPLGGKFLIIMIAMIIVGVVVAIFNYLKKGEVINALLLLNVLVGALSNLFDRLQYGFVIDYLDLKYFTVFNIADCMIVGGVILLILLSLKEKEIKA